MDWNFIGFSLNENKQIKDYRMLRNPYTSQYDPGNFFFEQARESLKGSYVPKEDIYCIAYPEKEENAEKFIKEMIRDKTLYKAVHFPLRDIAFVYENNPYPSLSSCHVIEGVLKKALQNPEIKRRLIAYHQYHQDREDDISNRVITAIRTNQGILLFDDTYHGLHCAESYLKYICDHFFSPIYKDAEKLQVYYFSTTNANLVSRAQECPQMFTLDTKKTFLPSKAGFMDSKTIAGFKPSIECDMFPDLSGYKEMLRVLQVRENSACHNIGVLDQIYKTGVLKNLDQDSSFIHLNSFQSLHNQIWQSYLIMQDNTLLKDSLIRAVKDTAKRILQNDYQVRGYELPVPEIKRAKKNSLKI
uniref:DUF6047 family protein n=1 Tax=Bacteroides ovatus TaxID=28116 RepID=UPI00359C6B50